MILFIWSIYVIIVGKYKLSWHYGVNGGAARICGIFNLLVSLGIVGSFIPVNNLLVSLIMQLSLIIILGILVVTIHGNDFKKSIKETSGATESVGYSSQNSRPQVTQIVALWKATLAFIGFYLVSLAIAFGLTVLILSMANIKSIPEIPNTIARTLTWIALPGIPFVVSLFFSYYGWYKRYEIIKNK